MLNTFLESLDVGNSIELETTKDLFENIQLNFYQNSILLAIQALENFKLKAAQLQENDRHLCMYTYSVLVDQLHKNIAELKEKITLSSSLSDSRKNKICEQENLFVESVENLQTKTVDDFAIAVKKVIDFHEDNHYLYTKNLTQKKEKSFKANNNNFRCIISTSDLKNMVDEYYSSNLLESIEGIYELISFDNLLSCYAGELWRREGIDKWSSLNAQKFVSVIDENTGQCNKKYNMLDRLPPFCFTSESPISTENCKNLSDVFNRIFIQHPNKQLDYNFFVNYLYQPDFICTWSLEERNRYEGIIRTTLRRCQHSGKNIWKETSGNRNKFVYFINN